MSTKTLRPKRIIIGVTGSVATIKLSSLINCINLSYSSEETEVKIVATNSALTFVKSVEVKPIEVLTDSSEWQDWKKVSDPILHIDLRNWADVIVVAPLSANTLAKIANGICDNLLVFLYFLILRLVF
jgi:phosphopantothenoylcysteine decarboxylase